MSGIIYTPSTGGGSVGDLDAVMMMGNTTTVNYIGTGIALNRTGVRGPITYRPDANDYLILCDVSLSSVNIQLNPSLGNTYAIKLVNWAANNYVRIFVLGGGTIDGSAFYDITRKHASVILASKKNNSDYAIIGSYQALSSTASGRYIAPGGFTGLTLAIPHTLNAVPTGITITPGDGNAALLLATYYYVSADNVNIYVTFTSPVGTPSSISIYWTVTKD